VLLPVWFPEGLLLWFDDVLFDVCPLAPEDPELGVLLFVCWPDVFPVEFPV
jgi:hypothetical protein